MKWMKSRSSPERTTEVRYPYMRVHIIILSSSSSYDAEKFKSIKVHKLFFKSTRNKSGLNYAGSGSKEVRKINEAI